MFSASNTITARFSRHKLLDVRLLASLEWQIVFTLIISQIWVFGGRNKIPEYVAGGIIVAGFFVRKEGLRDLGFIDLRCFCGAIGVLFGKFVFNVSLPREATIQTVALAIIGYSAWALFQQAILCGFFLRRIRESGVTGAMLPIANGIIFAVVHIPNPVLIPVAFIGGAAATYVFVRMKRKNLYLIAIVHAVVAVTILYAIPAAHGLFVGPAFWKINK